MALILRLEPTTTALTSPWVSISTQTFLDVCDVPGPLLIALYLYLLQFKGVGTQSIPILQMSKRKSRELSNVPEVSQVVRTD